MTITILWDNASLLRMDRALVAYGNAVIRAVEQVARHFEPILEQYAKDEAPWTDRTGNARQTLRSWSETLANDVVALYVEHGMDYGIHLERRWGGRYAILMPTIEAHLAEIEQMLQDIFA